MLSGDINTGILQGLLSESRYHIVPDDRQNYCSHAAGLEEECDENDRCMENVIGRSIISLHSSDEDVEDK
jgi:uncharacterized protein YbcI